MTLKSDKSNEGSCNIQMKVNKFNIVCSIEKFSLRPEKTCEQIRSPTCVVGSKDRSEWYLSIYPNGQKENWKKYVSIYLMLNKPNEAKVKFRLSILNENKEEENVRIISNVIVIKKNKGWGFTNFIERDFLLNESNGLLINDKLTILCEAEIIEVKSENHDNSETSINITIPQSKLPLDYGEMFESSFLTDCVIKTGNTKINAHKVILCARSSVFSDIFKNTLEKSQTSTIEIEGFSVEVVKEMLKYIYKDEVSNISNIASDVLAIADKYKLDRLKVIAAKSLCADLTIENVCKRFILSEKFSSKELKEFCQPFIINNAESLIKTKEWKKIVENHPFLVESLFLKLLNISKISNNSPIE
uniref:Speckle-type POZ protein-like (inferred by orthology to a human protein) n=1 Tax=Strongyloides venezuelensis TaxID=75913 RepID=A0A0K0FNX4_STRVS